MKELSDDFLSSLGIVDYASTKNAIPEKLENFKAWIHRKDHGSLGYLSDERGTMREDIRHIFPEFKSGLVFLFDYSEEKRRLEHFIKNDPNWNGHRIAGYVMAFEGRDYHDLIKARLEQVAQKIKESFPNLIYKIGSDSWPVIERDLAVRSGLGWIGKNSMMISKKHGSYTLIGSLLLNVEIEVEDKKIETDHCGRCQACAVACPTDAIDINTRTIKAESCISTFTIEHFKEDAIAPKGLENSRGEIFGCDICQDVCPWNKKVLAKNITSERSEGEKKLTDYFLSRPANEVHEELTSISGKSYERLFFGTPLKRTGRKGILKNFKFWLK
jgi:epoxyqueuosine reductase